MSSQRVVWAFVLFGGTLVGCGVGPDLVPVTGKVTMEGQPLDRANITFIPEGEGPVMTGVTDATGAYSLLYPGNFSGASAGKYRVTVEHYVMPDGSTPNFDLPGDDPNSYDQLRAARALKSTIDPAYSDPAKTQLSADVSSSQKIFDFDVEKAPSKK